MARKQKVMVITGCSAGLGRAIAREYGKNGYACGLISRNVERLSSLKDEIGKACIAPCDVSSYEALEKAATLIEKELGPIDVWINNAMASVFAEVREISPEEFKRVTEVTYLGVVYGTKVAMNHMKKGLIIQVGSALAYRGIPLQAPYCAAKHAIVGFTESLRSELLHYKSPIKVTMVHMPALNTPQFNWVKSCLPRKAQPVPPIFQPEVGAKAVYWASKHYRREWVVGLSAKKAIVGNKFIPNFIDHYLAKKGLDAQQCNGSADPNRKNNLFESVDGPYGAHGDFDARAKNFSLFFWLSKYRAIFWLLVLAVAAFLVVFLTR